MSLKVFKVLINCMRVGNVHYYFFGFRYKEGRVILERALVTESDGIEEIQVNNDD